MMTGIEQARIELAKWEARVLEDAAALTTAVRHAADVRERLQASTKAANSLRQVVQQWDKMLRRPTIGGYQPIGIDGPVNPPPRKP